MTLSDKIQKFEGWHSKENRFIHINNVKEAVKELKEEFVIGKFTSTFIKKKIDKIFGDKLVEEEGK